MKLHLPRRSFLPLMASTILLTSVWAQAQRNGDWMAFSELDASQVAQCIGQTSVVNTKANMTAQIRFQTSKQGLTELPLVTIAVKGSQKAFKTAWIRPSDTEMIAMHLSDALSTAEQDVFILSPVDVRRVAQLIIEKSVLNVYLGGGSAAKLLQFSLKGSTKTLDLVKLCRSDKALFDEALITKLEKGARDAFAQSGTIDEIKSLGQELLSAEKMLAAKKAELKALESQFAADLSNQTRLSLSTEDLRKSIMRSQGLLASAKNELATITNNIESAPGQIEVIKSQISSARAEQSSAANALAQAESQVNAVRNQLANAKKELSTVESQLTQSRNKSQNLVAEQDQLVRQSQQDQGRVREIDQKIADLEAEYDDISSYLEQSFHDRPRFGNRPGRPRGGDPSVGRGEARRGETERKFGRDNDFGFERRDFDRGRFDDLSPIVRRRVFRILRNDTQYRDYREKLPAAIEDANQWQNYLDMSWKEHAKAEAALNACRARGPVTPVTPQPPVRPNPIVNCEKIQQALNAAQALCGVVSNRSSEGGAIGSGDSSEGGNECVSKVMQLRQRLAQCKANPAGNSEVGGVPENNDGRRPLPQVPSNPGPADCSAQEAEYLKWVHTVKKSREKAGNKKAWVELIRRELRQIEDRAIRQAEDEIALLRMRLRDIGSEINRLMAEQDQVIYRQGQFSGRMSDLTRQIQAESEITSSLRTRVSSARANVDSLEQAVEREKSRAGISGLQARKAQADAELSRLQAELKKWEDLRTNGLAKKATLDRQIATLETDIPKLEGQLVDSEGKLAQVREKLAPFTEQKNLIDLDIQSMDSALKTKIEQIQGISVYLTMN